MRLSSLSLLICVAAATGLGVATADAANRWATVWIGAVQGPYPNGNPSAQPDLKAVFRDPAAGAEDQTFRMIVRPDVWGGAVRIRLSNAFGTRPVTFDGAHVGVQSASAAIVPGTNRAVRFAGVEKVTVAPGASVWSDPVRLDYADATSRRLLSGRKLAVSFHVVGSSGPMTWHAKSLQTSYVSRPGAGSTGAAEAETSFPFSTTSWYFLDAVDMRVGPKVHRIVAFGDSITDGTASTLNGDDRWPDAFSRRLHAKYGDAVVVANAGIGGNRVAGPVGYRAEAPFSGGPSAVERLERDVLSLSGVDTVIWLEGINDLNKVNDASVETIEAGMKDVAGRLHARGIRVIGATLPPALGSNNANHGSPEQDVKRRALNAFVCGSGVFDACIDFDAVTRDPATGRMRAEFVPESTTGGAGDGLHPNRAGYQAMANSIDFDLVLNRKK